MDVATRAVELVNQSLILALAVLAVVQWIRRRDAGSRWVARSFTVLACVSVLGNLLPEQPQTVPELALAKVVTALLLLFPYGLYRFAAIFEPPRNALDRVAVGLTAAAVLLILPLPPVPGPGEPVPWWYAPLVGLVLVQWGMLSLAAGVRLWRGGVGKPTLARRRMRTLSCAAVALTVALVIAGLGGGDRGPATAQLASGLVGSVSLVLFFAAFAPPPVLRLLWRRPEERALQEAQLRLMQAVTPEEVAEQLLPAAADLTGAVRVVLRRPDGERLAVERQEEGAAAREELTLSIEVAVGTLEVWTSPHTPYFGREELDLLRAFGAVIDLAWTRCELLQRERAASDALAEANLALQQEINERRLAAERLRSSEQQLREAQAIAHLGSWEWDIGSDVVTWSDELYRIYGVEPSSFQANFEAFVRLLHEEDRRRVLAAVTDAVAGRCDDYEIEHRISRSDGQVRWLNGRGMVVRQQGVPVRVVGAAQDITERKRVEENLQTAYSAEMAARHHVERLNRELESFVYSISHDLKSPLITLLGYLEYLEADYAPELPDEARHFVARMTASAAYMQDLIQDLLELSRIGRTQVEVEPVDPNPMIDEIWREVGFDVPDMRFDHGVLPHLLVNPLRLRQLFTNLIGNAVAHSDRPDTSIRVTADNAPDGGTVVRVRDDGTGIPVEQRERVFRVFERLRPRDVATGTGIGLSICKKVMESLGGSIEVGDASPGTEILLRFPQAVVLRHHIPEGSSS